MSASEPEPGLLFHLSGEHGTTADFSAAGRPEPTFDQYVTRIADGAKGAALQCDDLQLLAWRAPGNLYAQRGTIAFFWRSRYPTGPTEFPIFRVAYADHSSWDMVWLRIDYNGRGFDAFVTDASLARTRVTAEVQPFPRPDEWVHLALAWDETVGIRLYVNGKLAATSVPVAYAAPAESAPGQGGATVYDAGLDQFGFHSRVISPHNVLSESNYVRGGDVDELRIYDRMLEDEAVARLAAPGSSAGLPPPEAGRRPGAAWDLRHGWHGSAALPPYYPGESVRVRKVAIHDVHDLKRWWWKATDGIRETTWPGVYNRSRLPGRNDYFHLPDWDCYVESGRAVTFDLREEPWNHLEVIGAAWGRMELLPRGTENALASEAVAERVLFTRPPGRHRTVHVLPAAQRGGQVRFVNAEPEQPIAELVAYQVGPGSAPAGTPTITYRLRPTGEGSGPAPGPLVQEIVGRYPRAERTILVGVPGAGPAIPGAGAVASAPGGTLPIVHLLLPNRWDGIEEGLDGLVLALPALDLSPVAAGVIPFQVRVKDPLWPGRDLLDFSLSVKPHEAKTLWLDLRDRLLPPARDLWIELVAGSADFGAKALGEATVTLVFKPRNAALAEHEADRFDQAKDAFAMLVEEWPTSPKLNLWVRFKGDLEDLLRANPAHVRGRQYAAMSALAAPRPPHTLPEPPPGVPRWAFLQTQLLERVERFVAWQIEHRQVPYGDFGGGISDDTDMTNLWPGVALMGCRPEETTRSLQALLAAAERNGMFTRGLPTIQSDELHSYEEGINCLGQNLLLAPGSPALLERAMETARGVIGLTDINPSGHRHFRSSYFSATRRAEEEPWGRTKPQSYLLLHSNLMLVEFNGSPAPRRNLLELADGLLAHRRAGAGGDFAMPAVVRFADDAEIPWRSARTPNPYFPAHVFWAGWKWSGDERYLAPLFDRGRPAILDLNANAMDILGRRAAWAPELRRLPVTPPRWVAGGRVAVPREEIAAWQVDRDRRRLEGIFAAQIESCDLIEYSNTAGSLWTDRIGVPTVELQRTRLGGVALVRNALHPGHAVSWRFPAPGRAQDVALLIPDATPTAFTVIAHNLADQPVRTELTGAGIEPGEWEITQGIDTDDDHVADRAPEVRTERFGRFRTVELTLPPRVTSALTFRLRQPGTPYWARPDLGIDPGDVLQRDGAIEVRVHGLGAVASPAAAIGVRDTAGRILARAAIPALPAPDDLQPKVVTVVIPLPAGAVTNGASVEIDPEEQLEEITRLNNRVQIGQASP